MSWELTSFLILGAVLLGGFAWYERSRPPSQVVALVAALAALAIAGRIAFAAFPNVKPTTDIVIFAGYALGGAPGFAVGALTALVSNFWFGQGPWTPWQMVGWGLCGVLGAALALGTRNVGRLGLAATCGFAGIAYGALLNFYTDGHLRRGACRWQRFGVLEGQAVPFDAAHAIGNIVFALIAGPAMVRMLIRFRERFEWDRGEPRRSGLRQGRRRRDPRTARRGCRRAAARCPGARGAGADARRRVRDRPRRRLAALRPERRRRLRRLARRRLRRRDDRLGDAGAGGRRAQPARRLRASGAPRSTSCAAASAT